MTIVVLYIYLYLYIYSGYEMNKAINISLSRMARVNRKQSFIYITK